MSTQQQAQAGDNARIIQIIGDHNVVGDSPHLFITPLPPTRPAPTEPAKDEASLLRPVIEATDFVGRESLLADFVAWANAHEEQRPVSVRVIHGGAGVGKTRFGRELCRALGPDWQAGFVTNAEARRTLGRGDLGAWQWPRPTLIVFDYALTLVDALRVWLEELCAATPRAHPLRILLLERQADAQSGWLERLLLSGFGQYEMMPREFLDGEPLRLPDLSSPAVRIGIMQNMLARLGSAVVLPAEDTNFQTRLAATDWAGAPLYLMMAAMVMHQQGGVGEVLHLGRVDLALTVAEHEHKRLLLPCGDNASMQILVAHMAAFATLRGGIGARELGSCLAREREALGCDGSDVASSRRLLSDVLPDGSEGVAPLQPDIVGEAFLLKHLAGGRQIDGTDAVLRVFDDRPAEVVAALVRCVQDFVPRAETDASGRARAAGQRAMVWLRALGDRPDLPLETLLELTGALPEYTVALRELAVKWQSRVVEHLRQQQDGSVVQRPVLAGSLNNLAAMLSILGLRKEAREIAQEAVDIRRELAARNPDAFRPVLAGSLNNLANSLSELGLRKEAREIAQEATDLYRELAARNPDAFRPVLAISLNNLANRLSELGLRKEARKVVQEAVYIRRELAARNPDAFRPDLATSLNNLANMLSELGLRQEARKVAQEAVDIRRELAALNPNAFRPELAGCLNNLAIILSQLGQSDKALPIARESAQLYVALTNQYPEAFRQNATISLLTWLSLRNNISREEAFALFQQNPQAQIDALFDDDDSDAPSPSDKPTPH